MTAKKRRFQLYHFHCCKSICAPSLDKKGKHITSFTFTKIDSINVKNSIDKKKNVRTCITKFCTETIIKRKR